MPRKADHALNQSTPFPSQPQGRATRSTGRGIGILPVVTEKSQAGSLCHVKRTTQVIGARLAPRSEFSGPGGQIGILPNQPVELVCNTYIPVNVFSQEKTQCDVRGKCSAWRASR